MRRLKNALAIQSVEIDAEFLHDTQQAPSWGPGYTGSVQSRSVCISDVEPQAVPWVLDRILPDRAITLLGGPPKKGKSTIATELACCAAEGSSFLGVPFREPVSTLWFHGESEVEYEADYYHQRLTREELNRIHVLEVMEGAPLLEQIVSEAARLKTKLVIVDTITRPMDIQDGNSQKQVEKQLDRISTAARNLDVAILGITHFGKATQNTVQDRYLGSVKFVGNSRALWAVDHVHADVAEQMQLPEDTRALSVVSTNKGIGGLSQLFTIKNQRTETNPFRHRHDPVGRRSAACQC